MINARSIAVALCALAAAAAACIPGARLLDREPSARAGVRAMYADGARISHVVETDRNQYDADTYVLELATWLTPGVERAYVTLHEVCHAWQNRDGLGGDQRWRSTPDGADAWAVGMDTETAADVCALHYLGLSEIPIAPERHAYGAPAGPLPAAWWSWADRLP